MFIKRSQLLVLITLITMLLLATTIAFAQSAEPSNVKNSTRSVPDTRTVPRAVGGADRYGYVFADSDEPSCNTTFNDISGMGFGVGSADEGEYNIVAPFPLTVYGVTSADVRIANNGMLIIGETTGQVEYINRALPVNGYAVSDESGGVGVLPLWDDFDTSDAGIFTATVGTAPNRQFIVQWEEMPHYDIGGSVTFQAVFYEGSTDIDFVYEDVIFGHPAYDNGADGTVGLNQHAGNALQYSFAEPALRDGLAICFELSPFAFNKTVGLDSAECSILPELLHPNEPVEVTYCYQVINRTPFTLTVHDLVDSELGTLLNDFAFDLPPNGGTTFITRTSMVDSSIVTTATWTASDGTNDYNATSFAAVNLVNTYLDLEVVGSGGAMVGDAVQFNITPSNPLSNGINGLSTELNATLDVTYSTELDANAVITAAYYDTGVAPVHIGSFTEADLYDCVDVGDETTPRDPFSNTPGNGIDGPFGAPGSILCKVDVSQLDDALIQGLNVRQAFRPFGNSSSEHFAMFFDAPPFDRSYGFSFYGSDAPEQPGNGQVFTGDNFDDYILNGVPTGSNAGYWEVFLYDFVDEAEETPDVVLVTMTLDFYGWPYTTTVSSVSDRGEMNLTVGLANDDDFGALLSSTMVEIVSQPDWSAVCNGDASSIWSSRAVLTDPAQFFRAESDTVSHIGSADPDCVPLSVVFAGIGGDVVNRPMPLLTIALAAIGLVALWLRRRRA